MYCSSLPWGGSRSPSLHSLHEAEPRIARTGPDRARARGQFHDYHGVLSLMYLSETAKPSVLYVAHNADYNGAWALGSPGRERYLYAMFNLPLNRETRACAPTACRLTAVLVATRACCAHALWPDLSVLRILRTVVLRGDRFQQGASFGRPRVMPVTYTRRA